MRKHFLYVIFSLALWFATGCSKDACSGKSCNTGVCVDGTCNCSATYFDGVDCSIRRSSKFKGTWKGSYNIGGPATLVITEEANAPSVIIFDGKRKANLVVGSYHFNFDATAIYTEGGVDYKVTGSGSLVNDTTLQVTVMETTNLSTNQKITLGGGTFIKQP